MSLKPYLVVSVPNVGVSNAHEAKNAPLLAQKEERVHKMRLGTLCLPRQTKHHSHDKMDQPFLLCFLHTASNQKLDGGKASEQDYFSLKLINVLTL